ncbi:hypothetical protein [Streptomyces sp. NPDC052114]|uniref:hypothetical protein n=1 Tax=unclassified Streptomyces TaxID=2593676 RepID=UPI003425BB02
MTDDGRGADVITLPMFSLSPPGGDTDDEVPPPPEPGDLAPPPDFFLPFSSSEDEDESSEDDPDGIAPQMVADAASGTGTPARATASMAMVTMAAIAVAALRGTWSVANYLKARREHHDAVADQAREAADKQKIANAEKAAKKGVPSGPEFGRSATGKGGGRPGGAGAAGGSGRGTFGQQKPPAKASGRGSSANGSTGANSRGTGPKRALDGAGSRGTGPKGAKSGTAGGSSSGARKGAGSGASSDGRKGAAGSGTSGKGSKGAASGGASGAGKGSTGGTKKSPGTLGTLATGRQQRKNDEAKAKRQAAADQRKAELADRAAARKEAAADAAARRKRRAERQKAKLERKKADTGAKDPKKTGDGKADTRKDPKADKSKGKPDEKVDLTKKPKSGGTGASKDDEKVDLTKKKPKADSSKDGAKTKKQPKAPRKKTPRNWRRKKKGSTSGPKVRSRRQRKKKRSTDSGSMPGGDGDWLKPPPGWDSSYSVTIEREPTRPRRRRPAGITAGRKGLPPGTSGERTPTRSVPKESPIVMGTAVEPGEVDDTQFADADLTVYDLIESDEEMGDQILQGVDHMNLVAAKCEGLAAGLESLYAMCVEKKVPGVLTQWCIRLMERAGSVQDKAEALRDSLPRASEAILTARDTAVEADKLRADRVKEAGHVAPAEREYHDRSGS